VTPVNRFNRETELALARHFRPKPARIIWGERDMVLPAELIEDAWLRSPPGAEVTRIADAGHFVQEDAPFAGSL
jgi:pimeloyl-ACP methyl ester carboxylesterase